MQVSGTCLPSDDELVMTRREPLSLVAPDDAALAIRLHVDLDLQVEVDLVLRPLPRVAQRVLLLIRQPFLVGLFLRVCVCMCVYLF